MAVAEGRPYDRTVLLPGPVPEQRITSSTDEATSAGASSDEWRAKSFRSGAATSMALLRRGDRAELVRDAGFVPIDAGSVADSGSQSPGGDLYGDEFYFADLPALPRL